MGRRVEKCKVLFLAANPAGMTPLSLDREIREIEEKIRSSEHRDTLELITKWALRPDDLLQYLNQHQPHIVHFSGHGSEANEILLLTETGSAQPVSSEALAELCRSLKDNIRVVILNACFSRGQAEAIVEHIDFAVGMNKEIGDQAAITFAASFYRALGFGRSVQGAFDQGKTALMLAGISEEHTPELLCRKGADPNALVLLQADAPAEDLEGDELPAGGGRAGKRQRNPWSDVTLTGNALTNLLLLAPSLGGPLLWGYAHVDWTFLLVGVALVLAMILASLWRAFHPGGLASQFQKRLYDLTIENRWTKWCLAGVLALELFLYVSTLGYLRVQYVGEPGDPATISILTPDAASAHNATIKNGESLEQVFWQRPFSTREVVVRARGFHDLHQKISPFFVCNLSFPDDFAERHVVLLRPKTFLMRNARSSELYMRIKRKNVKEDAEWEAVDEGKPQPFTGQAIAIGYENKEEIVVPETWKTAIQDELKLLGEAADPKWKDLWEKPSWLDLPQLTLRDGNVLLVSVGTMNQDKFIESMEYGPYELVVGKNMLDTTGDLDVLSYSP